MKRIELEQSSESWLKWRCEGIGGSEVGTVLGVNPYEHIEDLFLIKTNQIQPKDLSKNPNVIRGQTLEPKAREIINEKLGIEFKPACFEMPNFNFCKYSSDGVNEDLSQIIEIKCCGSKNHLKIQELKGPLPYYYPQCQYGMMITGASVCWFASYNQSFPEPLIYFPVYSDKFYQAEMLASVAGFWKNVINHKLLQCNESSQSSLQADLIQQL